MQMADLHKVRVRAFVDEPEIGRLQRGQEVEVTWDALPGRVWKGTLESLPTTVVQHGTRMVGEVTCVMDNERPEAAAQHQRKRGHDHGAAGKRVDRSPRSDASGLRRTVRFQVVNGELKRRNVTTSVSNLTRIAVTGGLPDNAMLALGAT